MPAFAVSQQSDVHLSLAVLVLGAIVGSVGHITRVRWLIALGILLVGVDVVLFSFVVRPGAG